MAQDSQGGLAASLLPASDGVPSFAREGDDRHFRGAVNSLLRKDADFVKSLCGKGLPPFQPRVLLHPRAPWPLPLAEGRSPILARGGPPSKPLERPFPRAPIPD